MFAVAMWIARFFQRFIIYSIFPFLLKFFSQGFAIKLAYLSGITGLMLVFVAIIEGFISGLDLLLPSAFSAVVNYVIPGNTSFCISAIIAGHLARWMFNTYVSMLKITSGKSKDTDFIT